MPVSGWARTMRKQYESIQSSLMLSPKEIFKKVSLRRGVTVAEVEALSVFAKVQMATGRSQEEILEGPGKAALKGLSARQRMHFYKHSLERFLPHSARPKLSIRSCLMNSFFEDQLLWQDDKYWSMDLDLAFDLVLHLVYDGFVQGSTSYFLRPLLDATMTTNILPPKATIILYKSLSIPLRLEPSFVEKLADFQMLCVDGVKIQYTSEDCCSTLVNLSFTLATCPIPCELFVKECFAKLPLFFNISDLPSRFLWEDLYIALPVLFRFRHTPSILAITKNVQRMSNPSLAVRSRALLNQAMFDIRHLSSEEEMLAYVRGRRESQLLLDVVTLAEVAWCFLRLRGHLLPEFTGYLRMAFQEFIDTDYLPHSAFEYAEQLFSVGSWDPVIEARFPDLLERTALAFHAGAFAVTDAIQESFPLIDTNVFIGSFFVSATALLDSDTFEPKPWPADFDPASMFSDMQLPGIPVTLLVLSEMAIRCYRRPRLLGLWAQKVEMLRSRGWRVAVVGHADLSLQNDWYSEESRMRRTFSDATTCLKAMQKAAGGSGQQADDVTEQEDIFLGSLDVGFFEHHDDTYLESLFADVQEGEQDRVVATSCEM